MTVEDRLRDAFGQADEYQPSPDLFAKVQRSIEEDRARRRRLRLIAASIVGGLAAIAIYIAAFATIEDGEVEMPWQAAVALITVIMVALVVVLGPLIKRFGRTYVEGVFRANPTTGRHFLALLDVAYYLIFAAYIIAGLPFEADERWLEPGGFAVLTQQGLLVIAGLLLLMGLLHSITIFVLPWVGLIFSANWRKAERAGMDQPPPPDPRAESADRVVRIVVWTAVGLLGALVLFIALNIVIGVLFGAAG